MEHTLLVWQEIPENISTYLIPNSELEISDRLELLKLAHNKIINSDPMNDGLRFLNAALVPKDKIDNDDYFDDGFTTFPDGRKKTHEPTPKEWRCIFAKFKQDPNVLIENVAITRVVVSGMVM